MTKDYLVTFHQSISVVGRERGVWVAEVPRPNFITQGVFTTPGCGLEDTSRNGASVNQRSLNSQVRYSVRLTTRLTFMEIRQLVQSRKTFQVVQYHHPTGQVIYDA